MRWLASAALGVSAIGAGCFAWGLAEASAFVVRNVTLDVLPPGGPEVRVLHISDVHLMCKQHRKLAFLRSLSELAPDLVINTGDNICEASAVFPLLASWQGLRSVPGVFVFGSNDYRSPSFRNPLHYVTRGASQVSGEKRDDLPWQDLKARMEALGWVDLTHQRITLSVKGYRLAFRGTDDAHLDRDDYAQVAGPADPAAALNIGVTHAPYLRLLDAMTADGVDMIFAGHTHGGQVCLPGYGALVTNCDLDTARVKGLSTHRASGNQAHLHVSAGVGTSPFAPYRFACRPEVTLLTLRPAGGLSHRLSAAA